MLCMLEVLTNSDMLDRNRRFLFMTEEKRFTYKIGVVGEEQPELLSIMSQCIGKPLLDPVLTLGTNCADKEVRIKQQNSTLNFWISHCMFLLYTFLFYSHLVETNIPLVCSDAQVVVFMFDLTQETTLTAIKHLYQKVHGMSKASSSLLVGTNFNQFLTLSTESQAATIERARKYAAVMHAPLVLASAHPAINVETIEKIILSLISGEKPAVEEIHALGEPLIELTPCSENKQET